jgi:hypothetical protein
MTPAPDAIIIGAGPAGLSVDVPRASSMVRDAKWPALTPERFGAIYGSMNKLRSAALTTTATAYGGSPAGCAR